MSARERLTKERHLVSIFKRGKIWYLEYTINGKKKQRSTKLKDTLENKRKLQKEVVPVLTMKLVNGELETNKNKTDDFTFFANEYLSNKKNIKSYKQYYNIVYNQLIPKFGLKEIKKITRREVIQYSKNLLKTASPRRTKAILGILASIFDVAIDYEVLSQNPARDIKLPKHEVKIKEPFSSNEVELILSFSEGWFKNFLAVAFYTGARTGEVLGLMWNDVDFDNMTISINRRIKKGEIDTPKTKTSIRTIPMFEKLKPYLLDQMKKSKSLFVFTNIRNNKPIYDTKNLNPHWKRVLQAARLEYKILYITRHTFITTMLKSGKLSLLELAQIVGHSNTEMIVRNYACFIKGETIKIDRNIDPFTDKSTDSSEKQLLKVLF